VINRDGQVTVWNGALTRMTGLGRGAALGRALTDFATDDEAAELAAVLERTLAGEPVDGHETRLRAAGGAEARVAFNTAPVRGASGDVEGVVAIGQDLTRLRNLEAAAEQAEKMKAEMLEQTHVQQAELLERARRDIDSEKSKAIDELRREAIDLALAGASKVIEKNLDDAQNRKLVESYLSSIK